MSQPPFFNPSNYPEVRKRIRKLWFEGPVIFRKHARNRMEERRITALDIEHLVKYGVIVEHSKGDDGWKYKLTGKNADGERLGCVIEINARLTVITVLN